MITNVFSLVIDKNIKLTASDVIPLIELTSNEFQNLISDMYSLKGTLRTEKFSFDWLGKFMAELARVLNE